VLADLLNKGKEILAASGIEDPEREVELIVRYLAGVAPVKIKLLNGVITEKQYSRCIKAFACRAEHMPLAYIIGNTEFMGFEIICTPAALIPRQETELLAERVIEYLRKQGKQGSACVNVLDIGTGTGCISVAVAKSVEDVSITAIDVSEEAAGLAQRNVDAHGLSKRVEVLNYSYEKIVDSGRMFEVIVSNPPYIASGEFAELQPEVLKEPKLALIAGDDGLKFYRMFSESIDKLLRNNGIIFVEIGYGQEAAVRRVFESVKFVVNSVYNDYNGIPRIMELRKGLR